MELYDVMRTTFSARAFTTDPLVASLKRLDDARHRVERVALGVVHQHDAAPIPGFLFASVEDPEEHASDAFRRGFRKGFYISFLALHGRILLGPDDEDFEILNSDPYRISKGSQLDLFGG